MSKVMVIVLVNLETNLMSGYYDINGITEVGDDGELYRILCKDYLSQYFDTRKEKIMYLGNYELSEYYFDKYVFGHLNE